MTKAEKQERRKLRKDLLAKVKRFHFSTQTKVNMSPHQLDSNSRKVVDQLLAGKNPREVMGLDNKRYRLVGVL